MDGGLVEVRDLAETEGQVVGRRHDFQNRALITKLNSAHASSSKVPPFLAEHPDAGVDTDILSSSPIRAAIGAASSHPFGQIDGASANPSITKNVEPTGDCHCKTAPSGTKTKLPACASNAC